MSARLRTGRHAGSTPVGKANLRGAASPQPALMFGARMSLPHFSVSVARNCPNSAGVIGIGTAPTSASCAVILGSVRAALIALLSLAVISTGVLLGAPIPYQPLAS